jgi:hypothetical protein
MRFERQLFEAVGKGKVSDIMEEGGGEEVTDSVDCKKPIIRISPQQTADYPAREVKHPEAVAEPGMNRPGVEVKCNAQLLDSPQFDEAWALSHLY